MANAKGRQLLGAIWILTFLTFSLCSCGLGLFGTADNPETERPMTWQEQYDLGMRYLSEGNYEEAILVFTAAIEIDPRQAPAYVGRGDAYTGVARLSMEGLGEDAELTKSAVRAYKRAAKDYESAVDLDDLPAEVYQKAAEIYVLLGDPEAAAAILEQGVEATGDRGLQELLDELTSPEESAPPAESTPPETGAIQWQDPAFERMVRMALGKPEGEIFSRDLDGVNYLLILGDQYAAVNSSQDIDWAFRLGVGSDTVLTAFYRMEEVEFSERGDITSIADVVHFRNLTSFSIIANRVSDLSPLSHLEHLRQVNVWANDIGDLSLLDQPNFTMNEHARLLNAEQFLRIGDRLPDID